MMQRVEKHLLHNKIIINNNNKVILELRRIRTRNLSVLNSSDLLEPYSGKCKSTRRVWPLPCKNFLPKLTWKSSKNIGKSRVRPPNSSYRANTTKRKRKNSLQRINGVLSQPIRKKNWRKVMEAFNPTSIMYIQKKRAINHQPIRNCWAIIS